jgi:2-amino-4-hydroxy-6-hydroxymethyldihydropteridine diphosphokinase
LATPAYNLWRYSKYVKNLEIQIGRVRREKWDPSELDIDIIFYEHQIVSLSELAIPHSQYKLRDFIIKPLVDINPSLKDPQTQETLKNILEAIPNERSTIIEQIDNSD